MATILEVSFQKKFIPCHQLEPSKEEKTEKLRQELKDAADQLKVLNAKKVRLNTQGQVLDGLANKLMTVQEPGSQVSLLVWWWHESIISV